MYILFHKLNRIFSGPQSRYESFIQEKNPLPLTVIEYRIVQPADHIEIDTRS